MSRYSFRSVLLRGPLFLALLSFHGELYADARQVWGVESQNKVEVSIQQDADIERTRVRIKRSVEKKAPSIKRESIAFEEVLRYKRLEKTQELIDQLEGLIPRTGQSARRGELQMRLAELYFDRSKDVASQESEVWRKEVEKWETLSPEQRNSIPRPVLKTPKADTFRRQALNLYNDLEKRSRGADRGRSQLIEREEVLFYLGMTLVDLGQGRNAESYLDELITKYPQSARAFSARLQLADLYFDRGAYKKALPLYLQLASDKASAELSIQVRPYVFYKLAWCYFNTAAYDKAVLAYKKTAELAEQGGDASFSFKVEAERDLARTFALAGQYQDGINYFKDKDKALLREHLRNSADLAASRGQERLSLGYYQDLIRENPKALEARDFAFARLELLRRGTSSSAFLKELESVVENFGDGSDWMAARPSDERKLYKDEIVALMRREAKAMHKAAQRSRQTERFEAAAPYYELYFANVPKPNEDTSENLHEMKFYYAELLYHIKDFDKAEAYYAKVGEGKYSADAAYARILALREVSAKDRSRSKDLRKATEKFIADYPNDNRASDLLYASAFESYSSGNRRESKETLLSIIEKYPDADAGLKAAERYLFLLEEEGDLDRAVEGVDVLSSNTKLMKAHGAILGSRIMDFRERASFKKIEKMPESSDSERTRKAEAFLALAPSLSPSLQEKALNNALVYSDKAQNKELSARVGEELLKKYPKSSFSRSLYLDQGEKQARSGQWSASLLSYSKYLELGQKDKALRKEDFETALWNRILIQSHLENQVGLRVRRKGGPSRELIRDWDEFFKSFPRSRFRRDVLEFAAFQVHVNSKDLEAWGRLPNLSGEERELLEFARLASVLRGANAKSRPSILKSWPATKARSLPWEHKKILASWAFDDVESDYRAFSQLKLNFAPKAFAASLNKKTKTLEDLEKRYIDVVAYGDGDTALKSLGRMAASYAAFAEELAKAPVPAEQLADFVKPFNDKSLALAEECLTKAIEFKIAGEGLAECRSQMKSMNASRITLDHETLLSPGFIVPPPDASISKLWENAERALRENRDGELLLAQKVARAEMDQSRLPAEWQFYFANLEALQAWREGAGQWAVRKFREALEVTGDPHRELRRIVAMNLASVYLQVGDYSEAISLMEGLSRKSPEAALIAGVAWIGQSKFGEAAKLFDEATDAFKSRRELLFHAALAWSKAGDKNKAIERMKKYVELVTPPASDISRRLLKEWRESK